MYPSIALSLILVLSAFAGGAYGLTDPVMVPGTTPEGEAKVTPDTGISGKFGTWTVEYTVGPSGIQEGGGIRVQLPDAWHAGPRNSANGLQSTDPAKDHYVRATASRRGVKIQTIVESQSQYVLVKHRKTSLDGRSERYVFVVRVVVADGELKEGDTVSVIYGDRSGGSRGYRASAIRIDNAPILIAVDTQGTERFQLVESTPTITANPASPVEMLFHAPSWGVANKPLRMLIVFVDNDGNPAAEAAEVSLTCTAGEAKFPEKVHLPKGPGYVEFEAVPHSTGILRFAARVQQSGLEARSNPCRVTERKPERQLYWGDLHSHAKFSWDGVGGNPFDYARYVSGLDYYTLTDHALPPTLQGRQGLCRLNWNEYKAEIERHNDPPRFVTLQAYECSFGTPFGHHNVYFRDQPGPMQYPSRTTLPKLWAALEKGSALTIPHHTGKFPKGVQFKPNDDELRRNFEIYSGHGLSEVYNPSHSLAFEQSLFTSDSKSLTEPSFAQDVWAQGLRFSTVASSDDHRARPGQPHYGIAAVRATTLERDSIFQALYDKRTYGTSGAKVLLDFSVNDVPMGQEVSLEGVANLAIGAHGTDRIAVVDLLRCRPPETKFTVIESWKPDHEDFSVVTKDDEYDGAAIYYVRLTQENLIRGKAVMAWSSPIWTRPTNAK